MKSEFKNKIVGREIFENSRKEYLEKIKQIQEVIIWGTGSAGKLVYALLEAHNLKSKIKGFCDNAEEKWGNVIHNKVVLSPAEVINLAMNNESVCIIIASQNMCIRDQLISKGIDKSKIDVKGLGIAKGYDVSKEYEPFSIINAHIDEYEQVYNLLADERSKEVYMGILNYKISSDNDYLVGMAEPTKEQYFAKDIISFIDEEYFCDCGSFDGDTLEIFESITGGKYQKYFAIEADTYTYESLKEKISKNKYDKVKALNFACWDTPTKLRFESQQTAGHVTEDGKQVIAAETLDNILENEKVTFIKMDIEGAEERALIGAEKTIREQTPILAICLYHGLEDYYKLPLLMKKYNSEYNLYIRHYMDLVDSETVCYAIPKERMKQE